MAWELSATWPFRALDWSWGAAKGWRGAGQLLDEVEMRARDQPHRPLSLIIRQPPVALRQ